MRKKKKSCGCNNQPTMYNNKNMNYCQKNEEVCEDKCNYTKSACECNPKSCIPEKPINTIDSCKPTTCKPKIKEYTCPCEECEITCEDKCADLAEKAEELFNKAMKYEEKAKCALKEARELEQNAKNLSQKSCDLMQNAREADKGAKNATCSAQELMNKAEELCNKAKCLYKEANALEKQAEENCQSAKCAYEKAESYNEQAKYLYNQTLKYEQKTLDCYKNAEEKIKEFGGKSKKCQDLINKCSSKLDNCMTSCVKPETTKKSCGCNSYDKKEMNSCGCKSKQEMNSYGYNVYDKKEMNSCGCKPKQEMNSCGYNAYDKKDMNNCGCKSKKEMTNYGCNVYDKKEITGCGCKPKKEAYECNNYDYVDYGCQQCDEEIIQLVPEKQQYGYQKNTCGCMDESEYQYSYVNPMYDMTPMQYMGNMSTQYMTMETPYIMTCDDVDNMNDMWNNYYMYVQKMIQSMND